jgi:chromosome segregation ATPase
MQACYFPLDRATVPLCYNTSRTMNTDEKIVQALEALQEGQKALQADVQKQGTQIEGLIDVQQKQGKQLEALQADVKTLHSKIDTVELKVEAIHAYQKQAQAEIMDKLFESNEIIGHAHNALEKRIARIEKH